MNSIQSNPSPSRSSGPWGSRAILIPTAIAIGAVAFSGIRGSAGQKDNTPPVQPPAQALSLQTAFEQVADKLRPSVVYIESKRTIRTTNFQRGGGDDEGGNGLPFGFDIPGAPGGGQFRQFRMMPQAPRSATASGSGVIVRGDGYILTNDHVVQGADKVTVHLQDGRKLPGKVMRDFRSDLAVIKVEASGLPAAELADSDKVKIGQWAIAFGSPFGLNDTMTTGIVSSLHRNQQIGAGPSQRYYSSLIQTDASINPGNSGGPLVDIYGRVVGINVAIESPSGGNVGIGFAIPANTARYVMEQLVSKGKVTRGFLGLSPQNLSAEDQQSNDVTGGALVASVQEGTPADKAGFQVEDVIVRFDGKPVTGEGSLRDLVARTAPGTTVPVDIRRDGKAKTLRVTIGTPDEPQVAQKEEPAQNGAQGKLGVSIANANDADTRKSLNLEGDLVEGALVAEVSPGSPAAEAGIQPGDVIVRLNGKKIASAAQLKEEAASLKDGSSVRAVIRRGKQTVLVPIEIN